MIDLPQVRRLIRWIEHNQFWLASSLTKNNVKEKIRNKIERKLISAMRQLKEVESCIEIGNNKCYLKLESAFIIYWSIFNEFLTDKLATEYKDGSCNVFLERRNVRQNDPSSVVPYIVHKGKTKFRRRLAKPFADRKLNPRFILFEHTDDQNDAKNFCRNTSFLLPAYYIMKCKDRDEIPENSILYHIIALSDLRNRLNIIHSNESYIREDDFEDRVDCQDIYILYRCLYYFLTESQSEVYPRFNSAFVQKYVSVPRSPSVVGTVKQIDRETITVLLLDSVSERIFRLSKELKDYHGYFVCGEKVQIDYNENEDMAKRIIYLFETPVGK